MAYRTFFVRNETSNPKAQELIKFLGASDEGHRCTFLALRDLSRPIDLSCNAAVYSELDSTVLLFNFNQLGERWSELNGEDGSETIFSLLTKSLLLEGGSLRSSEAREFVCRYLEFFLGDVRFFSNMTLPTPGLPSWSAGNPLLSWRQQKKFGGCADEGIATISTDFCGFVCVVGDD